MGFALGVASKVKRIFSSPAKDKSPNGANPYGDSGPCAKIADRRYEFCVKDIGSKEEMFFDSRAWLDSDCEDDDYFSVKGDFTPSRGSTPNRQFGGLGTPQKNGKAAAFDDLFPDTKSEPSPTEKKKKLAELLQDSLGEQAGGMLTSSTTKFGSFGKSDGVIGKPATHEVEINQYQASAEETPKPRKERTGMAAACCMPGLVPGIISRKQKMSPAR